jgi:hypothetical protein
LTGDFYFQAALPMAATPAPATATNLAPDREAMFWDSVKGSSDPAEFKAYLDAFPNGTFAPLATARIRSIENSRQQASAAPRISAPAPAAASAPQQTAARSANGSDFSKFSGQLTARVPAGVLVSSSPFTFLTIAQSKLRFSAAMRTWGADSYDCVGEGDINAAGTFAGVMIDCVTSQMANIGGSVASGTLSSDGIAKVTFKSKNGTTTEVVFK